MGRFKRAATWVVDRPVLVVIALGLVVRLGVLATTPPASSNDTADYLTVAHMIGRLDFEGWNGARTPGFPIMVWAVRYNLRALEMVQQALGVWGAVLIVRTLKRVGTSGVAALGGGLSYALSPIVLLAETDVLTEAVAMFAVTAALSLVSVIGDEMRSGGSNRARWYVLLAVDLTWLSLTRPSTFILVLPVAIAVAALQRHRGWDQPQTARARGNAHPALLGLLVVMPAMALIGWSVFNARTSGYAGPTSLQGYSLSNATCDLTDRAAPEYRDIADVLVREQAARRRSTGDCADAVYYATPALQRATGLSTQDLSRRLTSLSLDLIAKHPRAYVRSVAGQWAAQWNYWSFGETEATNRDAGSPIGMAHAAGRAWVVALNLAFLGIVLGWGVQRLRRRTEPLPIAIALAGSIAILTSVENPLVERGALPRQLDPVHPAIILVVAYAIGRLAQRIATGQACSAGGR